MDFKKLQINHAIIKAISVFDVKNNKKFEQLVNRDFLNQHFNPKEEEFLKNYFYPEFRSLLFSNIDKEAVKAYSKKIDLEFTFMIKKNDSSFFKHTKINIKKCELFLFPSGLHLFSIDYSISNVSLQEISDINFIVQKLEPSVYIQSDNNEPTQWINWIEQHCLQGTKIITKNDHDLVSVDAYSGSKFKLYNVLETKEELSQDERLKLLYDIGCNAIIGSAGSEGKNSPSKSYYEELISNKISIFKNYDILPLFDSFTVIGHELFDSLTIDKNQDISYKTWSDTYLRIILHSLFLKFNLFKYNINAKEDSIKTREEFESFINQYNFSHISYNFLPNLFIKNHRKALEIDTELALFQQRINRINQEIQERQQTRMNTLITIVTVLSSFSSISPIYDFVDSFREKHAWSNTLFYGVLSIPFILLASILVRYIFPDQTKILLTKIKKTIKN